MIMHFIFRGWVLCPFYSFRTYNYIICKLNYPCWSFAGFGKSENRKKHTCSTFLFDHFSLSLAAIGCEQCLNHKMQMRTKKIMNILKGLFSLLLLLLHSLLWIFKLRRAQTHGIMCIHEPEPMLSAVLIEC